MGVIYTVTVGRLELYDYLGQVYDKLGDNEMSLEAFKKCKTIVTQHYRHFPQHPNVCICVQYLHGITDVG